MCVFLGMGQCLVDHSCVSERVRVRVCVCKQTQTDEVNKY